MCRSVVVLIMMGSLSAAELVMRDIRVGIDLLPVEFDYTLHDSTGTRSGHDVYAQNIGLALGGRYSLARIGESHGAVVGAEVAMAKAEYAPANGTVSTYQLVGEAGYGWAPTDSVTLVALARLGAGLARGSFQGAGAFQAFSPQGPAAEYGVRVGVVWSITDQMALDGLVGWRHALARMAENGRELAVDASGVTLALGWSWRFTSSPWRLE